jgi:hypothetical protein
VPGDAANYFYYLVLEDGSLVKAEVVDGCTMLSVVFAVRAGDKCTAGDLERMLRGASERLLRTR